MPSLRLRLEFLPPYFTHVKRLETINDFELSIADKYRAGIELIASGHGGPGIYLLGYAAEMILKNACFRLDGARPDDRIDIRARLAPMKAFIQNLNIRPEGFHNLKFWAAVLFEKRKFYRMPLDSKTERALLIASYRLYQNWWVNMRYRAVVPTKDEIDYVLSDVTWLRDHYSELWR